MPTDQVVQVTAPGTGAKIDVSEVVVGANTTERQRINISDPTSAAAHAGVTNAAPGAADYGLEVRNVFADVTANAANLTTAIAGASFACAGYPGVGVNITGSGTGLAYKAQISTDGGTTWTDTYLQTAGGVTALSFTTQTGQYAIGLLSGTSHVRISVTAIASGTLTYQYRASQAVDGPFWMSTSQPVGTEPAVLMRPVSSYPDVTVAATTVNGSGQTVQIAFSGQVGASFQLTGGGSLVCTITPQLSIDGGTNWFNTYMEIPGTSQVISSANIANLQGYTQWTVVPAAGASHARLLVTSFTGGTATFTARAAQIIDSTDEDAGPPGSAMPPIVSAHGAKDPGGLIQALQTTSVMPTGLEQGLIVRNIPSAVTYATYSASKAGGVGVASATDVATIIGSATKTVYITRFIFDATIATTAALGTVALVKRSAADTTGTKSTTTAVPNDSGSAAATAVCSFYTANPGGLGTAVGNVRTWRYWFQLAATSTSALIIDHTFTNPIALRGVAENLACNLSGQGANATTIDVTFEWYEL